MKNYTYKDVSDYLREISSVKIVGSELLSQLRRFSNGLYARLQRDGDYKLTQAELEKFKKIYDAIGEEIEKSVTIHCAFDLSYEEDLKREKFYSEILDWIDKHEYFRLKKMFISNMQKSDGETLQFFLKYLIF